MYVVRTFFVVQIYQYTYTDLIQLQWILDLVTIDLVTILNLVTVSPLTSFLFSKMQRFSDNFKNFSALI